MNIWTYFLHHGKITLLVTAIALIWGGGALLSIPKEAAPYIAYNVVTISTTYAGASALDIDELITEKILDEVDGISGLTKYSAGSYDSFSSVVLEFDPTTDMVKAMSDLRSKVDVAQAQMPNDLTSDPSLHEIDSANDRPLIDFVLLGKQKDTTLRTWATELRQQLKRISGVSDAKISGGAEREIAVLAQPTALAAHGLTLDAIVRTIRTAHHDVPAGNLTISGADYAVRVTGKLHSADEVAALVVANRNGSLVRIRDIATVRERAVDKQQIYTAMIRNTTGEWSTDTPQPAVRVRLTQKSGQNVFALSDRIKTDAEAWGVAQLPADARLAVSNESAVKVWDSYENVIRSGLQSFVVVLLLIFLFVGFAEGVVASLVIPITLLITIGALAMSGRTLNFMVNFSMILALGILVDTAIVIVEGAHHFMKKQGMSGRKAALASLREYRAPLIAGWLTTLVVFLPLYSLPGIMGQYLSFIPITIGILLTVSLAVSLFLLPSYAAWLVPLLYRKKNVGAAHSPSAGAEQGGGYAAPTKTLRTRITAAVNIIIARYERALAWLLDTRARRLGALTLITVAFFASLQISIPFKMFPSGAQPFIDIEVNLPQGSTATATAAVAEEVVATLALAPEVFLIENKIDSNAANIHVELIDDDLREARGQRTSVQLADDWQSSFDAVRGGEVRVRAAQQGPPSESPGAWRVIASDTQQLLAARTLTEELTKVLRGIDGAVAVTHDIEQIPGELRLQLDRAKASTLGIDAAAVANTVRVAVSGTTAATLTRGEQDIDIVVTLPDAELTALSDILQLPVITAGGARLTVGDITTVTHRDALAQIRRQNGDIAFTVSSLVDDGMTPAEINEQFLAAIDEQNIIIPEGITLKPAGENADNAALFTAMGTAMIIAILLMFLVMVVIFDSFGQPLLILATLLFAQIGVTSGLWLTETARGLPSILGTIALFGIVVNDAIIMVDQLNRKTQHTHGTTTLFASASASRFVPVVLTTLTTSAGILPLVFIDAFWASLAYTIIFGLSLASLLTLFLTPALFVQLRREAGMTALYFVGVIAVLVGGIAALQGKLVMLVAVAVGVVLLGVWRWLVLEPV